MRVTLYTKPGCHLCDVAHGVLVAAQTRHAFDLTEVDIERDPAVFERFQYDIPVVEIDGRRAFKHRIDPAVLERRLSRQGDMEAAPTKKYYSGLPDDPRMWVVPRWMKAAFAALALGGMAAVVGANLWREFGGVAERARLALDGDLIDPPTEALAFTLPVRGGGVRTLADYRGKVVFVNFWATWCPPCRDEMPSFSALSRALDPATFALAAVSVDEGWPAIDGFFSGAKLSYDVLLDPTRHLAARYGTNKFPETYVLDGQGRLRLKFVGARDWSDPNAVKLFESLGARRAKLPAAP